MGPTRRPDAIRALKQVRKGDRVLCYHSAPERSLYAIAEVTRDPYPESAPIPKAKIWWRTCARLKNCLVRSHWWNCAAIRHSEK